MKICCKSNYTVVDTIKSNVINPLELECKTVLRAIYRYSCNYNFAEACHLELNLKRDDALDELRAHLLLECSEVGVDLKKS